MRATGVLLRTVAAGAAVLLWCDDAVALTSPVIVNAPSRNNAVASSPRQQQPGSFVSRRDVAGAPVAAASLLVTVGGLAVPRPALAAEKVDASQVRSTPGGAKYVIVKEGTCPTADPTGLAGSCAPQPGSYCILDYTGFLPSGAVFDSTESKGRKPLAFRLGERQVIAGIEEIVAQMKPGEEVQALIPAALAYGDKGVCPEGSPGECLIPPNTNLKYFLRLVRTAVAAG